MPLHCQDCGWDEGLLGLEELRTRPIRIPPPPPVVRRIERTPIPVLPLLVEPVPIVPIATAAPREVAAPSVLPFVPRAESLPCCPML